MISSTTGTSFIDKKYCKSKKIKIISLEKDSKFLSKITSTAEHTFGLLLMLIRNYIPALNAVNKGKFNRRPFWRIFYVVETHSRNHRNGKIR